MKENESIFFKVYCGLFIINAIIGLAEGFLITSTGRSLGEISMLYLLVTGTIWAVILIMSVVAIFLFSKYKFSKITLVLPIYFLVITTLVFLYGMVWGLISSLQGISVTEQLTPPGLAVVSIISSLFELAFSVYLLYRYK